MFFFSLLFSSTGTVGPGYEARQGGCGATAPLAMDVGIAEEIDVAGRETVDQVKKTRIFFVDVDITEKIDVVL